jgi:hypothetical protein
MIDYEGASATDAVNQVGLDLFLAAERRIRPDQNAELYTFATGRSFHQYCTLLLTEADWRRLFGDMLLVPRDRTARIDTRWIGHAMRKGYAALRWTANTDRYLHEPTLVSRSHLRS